MSITPRQVTAGFWILVVSFIGFLILALPAPPNSQVAADTSTTSVTVGNEAPSVGSVTASSVTLSEATAVTATSTATVTDNNGWADVATISAVFYDAVATTSSCSADNNSCYLDSSCTVNSTTSNTLDVTCSVSVQYYANASDWKWTITAEDDNAATGSNTSASTTISTLTALDVTGTINYGTVALGATSSEQTATITNTGNKNGLDAQVSGTDMTCTTGTIDVSKQHYATSSGFAYASGTALATSSASLGLSIAQRTNGTTTANVYWKLQVPTGVEGSCSGTNTFTAQ